MHETIRFDRAPRSDEGLTGDLSTEDALLIFVGTYASEQIHLDLVQIEEAEEFVEGGTHERQRTRRRSPTESSGATDRLPPQRSRSGPMRPRPSSWPARPGRCSALNDSTV